MIGHSVPVYSGYASQYGYGLGNVLGGLMRAAIPIIKPVVASAGRHLLSRGVKKLSRKLNDIDSMKKTKKKKKKRGVAKNKHSHNKKPRDIFG